MQGVSACIACISLISAYRLAFLKRQTRMSQNNTRSSPAVDAKNAESFPGRFLSSTCQHMQHVACCTYSTLLKLTQGEDALRCV